MKPLSTGRFTRYCCVYRAFAASGALLYVGSTINFEGRRKQHWTRSKWGRQVVHWKVRWYLSEAAAHRAETAAIRAEHPIHNVRGRDQMAIVRALREFA